MLPSPAPVDRSVLTRWVPGPDTVLRYGPEEDRVHVRPMTEALTTAGWTTVAPEYRRVPGRPDLAVQDVHAAVRAVAGRARSAGVLLVGHSAGGHLVLQAAATMVGPEVPVGVAALAPVADLRRAQALGCGGAVADFLGEDAAARPDLDSAQLPAPAVPVPIVHGTADEVVPAELSESYAAARPRAVLVPVPAGHFAVIDPRSAVRPTVPAALQELAGTR
ncbi:alpha/beta fold hydrolase [Blastococcus sp. HT6-30]|uniref:alpha/beta hydrolase n=1 Tax=Blastococcus sp. HT6-30 TaxID=3144843 RepID=UPI0032191590